MDTRESLLDKLVEKVEEDSDFHGRLLANPRSALKEDFGIEVPEDVNVVVHQDDSRTAHIVLPDSTELTDAQLQQAAGGDFCNGHGVGRLVRLLSFPP